MLLLIAWLMVSHLATSECLTLVLLSLFCVCADTLTSNAFFIRAEYLKAKNVKLAKCLHKFFSNTFAQPKVYCG